MLELKSVFDSGTITDNPLLIGGTTVNSAEFASRPEVLSGEFMAITLDPSGSAPEIVHVTAHTASATSATVVRGQEGTSAKEHAQNITWQHAPVARDVHTGWTPGRPPRSPHASDDEFSTIGSGVPTGWTAWDPGTRALSGYPQVGMGGLEIADNSNTGLVGVYKAIPAGAFSIYAHVSVSAIASASAPTGGLALFEDAASATADIFLVGPNPTNGVDTNGVAVKAQLWSQHDTFASEQKAPATAESFGQSSWYLQMHYDETDMTCLYSTNGLDWIFFRQTNAFTPQHMGLAVVGTDALLRCTHFRVVEDPSRFDDPYPSTRVAER